MTTTPLVTTSTGGRRKTECDSTQKGTSAHVYNNRRETRTAATAWTALRTWCSVTESHTKGNTVGSPLGEAPGASIQRVHADGGSGLRRERGAAVSRDRAPAGQGGGWETDVVTVTSVNAFKPLDWQVVSSGCSAATNQQTNSKGQKQETLRGPRVVK